MRTILYLLIFLISGTYGYAQDTATVTSDGNLEGFERGFDLPPKN